MKKLVSIFIFSLCFARILAQDSIQLIVNEILDYQSSFSEQTVDGEELYLSLKQQAQNPLSLNVATKQNFEQLSFLDDDVIENLMYYRYEYGPFVSKFELNAIEGLEPQMVKWLQHFVVVDVAEVSRKRRYYSNSEVMYRAQLQWPLKKGFQVDSGNRYRGSPTAQLVKLQGNVGSIVNWNITMESDPGELDMNKVNPDFYSASVEINPQIKYVHKVVFGDFHVRAGQGLAIWTGSAFNQGVLVGKSRKKGNVISPYRSSLENGFMRGGAIETKLGKAMLSTWVSNTQLDGSLSNDSVNAIITGIGVSGYHRTESELQKKHNVNKKDFGAHLQLPIENTKVGFTYNYGSFDMPFGAIGIHNTLQSSNIMSYQHYAVDFLSTFRRVFIWGEIAGQNYRGISGIVGIDIFPSDLFKTSITYRNYSPSYFGINSNALGESGRSTNEEGINVAAEYSLGGRISLQGNYHIYSFPWLRYNQTSLQNGKEYTLRTNMKISDQATGYIQFRSKTRNQDYNSGFGVFAEENLTTQQNFRFHVDYSPNPELAMSNRIEYVHYKDSITQEGWLVYQNIRYSPRDSWYSLNARVALFYTDNYNSRVYTYENDVLYAFAIPMFYGRGIRYYGNVKLKPTSWLDIWLKLSRTQYFDREVQGSGLDEIKTSYKNNAKVQLRARF